MKAQDLNQQYLATVEIYETYYSSIRDKLTDYVYKYVERVCVDEANRGRPYKLFSKAELVNVCEQVFAEDGFEDMDPHIYLKRLCGDLQKRLWAEGFTVGANGQSPLEVFWIDDISLDVCTP